MVLSKCKYNNSNKNKLRFKINLPSNLKFLIIDIGSGKKPILPLNQHFNFHVLSIEPFINNSNVISKLSDRLHVLTCGIAKKFGFRSVFSLKGKKLLKHNLIKKRSFNIITIPLCSIINAIPKNCETFIRINSNNFNIEAAEDCGDCLKRISLLKKELNCSKDSDNVVKNKWLDLIDKLGFELIKIENNLKGNKELVWINTKIIQNRTKIKSILFNEKPELINIKKERIKNYIKHSFNVLFFGSCAIIIKKSNDKKISVKEGCWKTVFAMQNKIPVDAFQVNNNNNENSQVYITRSFFKGGIHCGSFDTVRMEKAIFCWKDKELTSIDYQIMCGTKFNWKKFENRELPQNTVVGGRDENGLEIYVTRVIDKGKMFIGKLYEKSLQVYNDSVIKCQYYERSAKFTENFEVLVYSEN